MKKFITYITSILIIGATSCETTEKIDDFPLRPSKMVMNCYFTGDSTWNVQVSKSLSVLDNADLQYLKDASVKLYRDDVLVDSANAPEYDGWYRMYNSLPDYYRDYRIEVSSPKFRSGVKAEDYLPLWVNIARVETTITDSTFYRDYYYWDDVPDDFKPQIYGQVEGT
ncbi:hypothetical protein ACFLT1_09725, partial [Bacteroidota bacterium]